MPKKAGNTPSKKAASARKVNISPETQKSTGGFFIAGIGASAGGLEAFEQFFTKMPPESGIAFILIPHLDPTHKSIMQDLLKRYTTMAIFEAEDGMKVRPNNIYIIPPNKDMSIFHGSLQLMDPKEARGLRHPIDFFFRSLAEDQREKSICIILSGTGTEGALGLKAIKGEGGLVIVQDPKTAKYDGMPLSAIATGIVDTILPPDKIPDQLMHYVTRVHTRPLKQTSKPELRPTDLLQKIYVLIRSQTGQDFSLYKQNTVVRRIERRMAIHQIEKLEDYVQYLRSNTHEVEELFKELLIRVTNFFRDSDAFETLKKKAIPQILKNRTLDTPVRVWVPGCSTGEEAYSLAIIFNEAMLQAKEKYKVQIFATDIDGGAIEIARAGIYPESITVDVSPERLNRYFIKKGNTYKIKDEIRETVVFAVQNLIKDPPFSKLDMISCRNLLIYLNSDIQKKKVLPLFHYSLNPESFLFLGSSETIGEHIDIFNIVDKKWKLFKARKLEMPAYALGPMEVRPADIAVKNDAVKKINEISIGDLTEKLLLEHFSPPCAVINDKGDILYLHGRTGKYLEPAPGKPALNIIEMAREGLRLDLRTAIHKAVSIKDDVHVEGLQVKTNGSFQNINLIVSYVKKPEYLQGLLMVVFQSIVLPKSENAARTKAIQKERGDQRIVELEFELKSTKEHLQTVIEELETSNEELKSMNEELQSSNEELQSTNEELETSKEELQSVNEELVTVNSELQNKIEELSQINNDMNNLLASTQIATIFLDNDLRIKRFTPAMTGVFNLIQTDIGRPISDMVSKLDYPALVKDAEEVIRTLTTREITVQSNGGPWYLTRIMPYRTAANVIDGVVVTFIDITEQKMAQEAMEAMYYVDDIVELFGLSFLVLDSDLRILYANDHMYRALGIRKDSLKDTFVYDLTLKGWSNPDLFALLGKILPDNLQIKNYPLALDFPKLGIKNTILNAKKILKKGKETGTILVSISIPQDK